MRPSCSATQPGVTRTLLCFFLFSGTSSSLRQYHFINESMSWQNARRHCQNDDTVLATVDSMSDMQQLVATAGGGFEGNAWFGLYDQFHSWHWSLDNETLGMRKVPVVDIWGPGEPNGPRVHNELCSAVWQGRLYDVPCHLNATFLCYTNADMPGISNISTERYFYIDQRMTWHQARAQCQRDHVDLASMRSNAEVEVVVSLVPYGDMVLVGAYRRVWGWWADGVQRNFRNWLPGEPPSKGGNCAYALIGGATAGKWVSSTCSKELPFFCLKVSPPVVNRLHIQLSGLKSATDLNEPTLRDGLLKLIEKKLKENGITTSFKTSWKNQRDGNVFQRVRENAESAEVPCV